MTGETSIRKYRSELSTFAISFTIGLLFMGYAAVTYWQYAYMRANPAAGDISTSTGGIIFNIVLFVIGSIMAFTAFMTALYQILDETAS